MKRFLYLTIVLALGVAGCSQGNAPTAAPPDASISLAIEPEPVTVGESTLMVTLRDGSGDAVDGATLNVQGNMDHAGMAAVERVVNVSSSGEYTVPFEWTMGGGWTIIVTASLPDNGGEVSQTFDTFVEAVSSESIIRQGANSGDDSMSD